MVDKATFRRINPNSSVGLPINATINTAYEDDEDVHEEEYNEEDNGGFGDRTVRLTAVNGLANGQNGPSGQKEQRLSDDDYVLATPIVYGFALDDKQWVEFNINLVEPIVWNDAAFANLVLPAEKKALIQALVEAHNSKDRVGFDDFIIGKGQGLVIK
jgi:hypothetical protein